MDLATTELPWSEYVALKNFIAALFEAPLDVVNRAGLKPFVRPAVTADAIYAF